MIVANGTLQGNYVTGGGLDEHGDPVPVTSEWGTPIPCHIKANHDSKLGYSDGNTFTIASYTILIELQEFTSRRIRLFNQNGRFLGEFAVMPVDLPLDHVQVIRIVV